MALEQELFTYKLINEIRKQDCLFNKNHPDYRNMAAKQIAWQVVAAEVNTDVDKCREKWTVLRDCFVQELDKLYRYPDTNDKEWMYFYNMMFLKKYIKKRRRTFITTFVDSGNPSTSTDKMDFIEETYDECYDSDEDNDTPVVDSVAQANLLLEPPLSPTAFLVPTLPMTSPMIELLDDDHPLEEGDIMSLSVEPTSPNNHFLTILDEYLMQLPNATQDEVKIKVLDLVYNEIINSNNSSFDESI